MSFRQFIRQHEEQQQFGVACVGDDFWCSSACLELDQTAQIISYEEYHPFGTTSYRSGRTETEVSLKRYKYVGKERDEETGLYYYGARYYAAWICRFVSVDPMASERSWVSPYSYCQNSPIIRTDPTGALDDWYKTAGGSVEYDASVKSQANLDTKGIVGTYLSADKYSSSVLDAIGADIMNTSSTCTEKGWNKFISYVANPNLGKDYFIDAATKNYNDNASGFMGVVSSNISGVTESIRISQMTHGWADASGWTSSKNKMEHYIGMFLIADKFGESKASFIGTSNEVRGLIINDRQSGRMWEAISGGNRTAFEWRDIMNNNDGLERWRSYRGIVDPVNAARKINTVNGVYMAPWNDFGTK